MLDQKKILIIYDVSYPHINGGGQRRFWEVARRLLSQGFEIDWICFKTWPEESSVIENDGIRYIGLAGYKGLYRENGKRRIQEPIEFVVALARHKVDLKKYDVIWTGQWPLTHLIWWLFCQKFFLGSKLIIDWWEIWGSTWFSYSKSVGWIGFLMERLLLRSLVKRGRLVFISPQSFEQAKQLIQRDDISLIHNGIDFKLFEEPVVGPRDIDLIYLGRLKEHKRVDLLLHAICYIRTRYGLALSLTVIGDGPEFQRLENLTQDLKISELVDFKGAIASNLEIVGYMRRAKLFVNPSIKEGGGSITLFEAYASGMPAVLFRCKDGVDPSLVVEGKTGTLVSKISLESLGEAIYKIMMDKENLNLMSVYSKDFSSQFDWDLIACQYKAIFDDKKIPRKKI